MAKLLNDDTFQDEIKEGVTLVDYFADWCGPCRMIAPILEDLASEMEGKASICKLDIETAQKTASDYNVTSIPTLILFKDGNEVDRVVGVKDHAALKELIENHL